MGKWDATLWRVCQWQIQHVEIPVDIRIRVPRASRQSYEHDALGVAA